MKTSTRKLIRRLAAVNELTGHSRRAWADYLGRLRHAGLVSFFVDAN